MQHFLQILAGETHVKEMSLLNWKEDAGKEARTSETLEIMILNKKFAISIYTQIFPFTQLLRRAS